MLMRCIPSALVEEIQHLGFGTYDFNKRRLFDLTRVR